MYQITNLVNGKIYIGVHKTEDLNDSYMGSGKYLKLAQRKYGLANFKKEILEQFSSLDEMFLREAELVNPQFINRKDTYNIIEGGRNTSGPGRLGGLKAKELQVGYQNPEIRKRGTEKIRQEELGAFCNPTLRAEMQQRSRTADAIAKKKETFKQINHQKGEANSQFGKKWITNGSKSTRIERSDPIPEGWRIGRVIKRKE